VRTTPTWFGAPGQPLFGWFHLPASGRARGMAVLCSPLGREEANATPALQMLGDTLAAGGVGALRFDYAGTGDSTGGSEDPDRLAAWLSSVGAAVDLARQVSPGPVVLIGMRMGALLASEAMARGLGANGFVGWDPCPSGRTFFRLEQTLLATGYGVGQIGDGSVAGPAFVFSPETVAEVSPLRFSPDRFAPTLPVLLLERGDDRPGGSGSDPGPGTATVRMAAIGQAELLDVYPDLLSLPTATIEAVAQWVGAVVEGPDRPLDLRPADSAVVGRDPAGREITEHAVGLGPHRLFGMVTDPGWTPEEQPPTLVFLSAGALAHTGPGRMWVVLARQFAALGLRSVRVDLDGLGESFGRPDLARQVPKHPEALDDLGDLAAALGDPDAGSLVFIGLSSGAYHAIEAGLRFHPAGVCAVNPGLVGRVPEADRGPVDPRRLAFRPMPGRLRALAVRHERVARWIWWAALQVWVTRSPAHPVAGVGRRGVPMLLVVCEGDARQFEPSPYWSRVKRRLQRRRVLDVEIVPGGDHSLYTPEGKSHAYPLVRAWVTERFAP
jgi:alpha-beta hydrolase superfamily lysophospholipase